MRFLVPFWIALGLLTRIPAPGIAPPPSEAQLGRSVLCYPLVGLLLGGLLTLCAWMSQQAASSGVGAALLLVAWVWLTGGLHLEGLADSADAWIGGLGDRERALAIMKDPRCGPAAVMTVALLLLLKFAALQTVLDLQAPHLLLPPVVLGRMGIVALFLRLPYVRPNGMGAVAAASLPRSGGWLVLALGAVLVVAGWRLTGVVLLLVGAGVWYLMQAALARRFGGTTGDTAGAVCEIMETALLTALTLNAG
ncbi:MAG: adenosylcobinamide-GDP ribazoletransferase [Magnetococcales bacterium]|nr:adenosylcobinamide-GDP ribazoletransferase [Magnetococcales bacterium]